MTKLILCILLASLTLGINANSDVSHIVPKGCSSSFVKGCSLVVGKGCTSGCSDDDE